MSIVGRLVPVMVALVCALVPFQPAWVERHFSTGVYPAIQRAVTPVSNLVPFALFDVLTVIGGLVLIVALASAVRAATRERRLRPLLVTVARVATAAAVVYLVFLGLWGLNYQRLRMADRLVMERDVPDAADVLALGQQAAARVNTLYAEAHRVGWANEPRLDATLVEAFTVVQQRLSDAMPAVPGRLKQTVYGSYFRWTSVDGMVNPFALEVLANPDLLPFERPFVAAHEWAHLAGYAHEAEANFVGWLTCVRADVPAQYSAWLYLFWQVSGEISQSDRGNLWNMLAAGPRRDVDAMVERIRRGQLPLLRRASWLVYDQYLRANRVEEGVRAYGEVVTLLLRARFDEGWTPVRRLTSASSP